MALQVLIFDNFDRSDRSGLGFVTRTSGLETVGDLVVDQAPKAVQQLRERALVEASVWRFFVHPSTTKGVRPRVQIARNEAYIGGATRRSIAYLNAFTPNVDVRLNVSPTGGTHNLYFRVRDYNNWWRVRLINTDWTRSPVLAAVLERCINGHVSLLGSTGNVRTQGTINTLRVLATGVSIEAFTNLRATPFVRVRDNRLADQTRHGFGRDAAEAELTRTNGSFRAFDLRSTNTAPAAPILEYPKTGYAFDIERANQFRWRHVDPDARDGQTAAQIRWRRTGETSWETRDRPGPSGLYVAPAGTFTTGSYFWSVRTRDSRGAWGPWATPTLLTTGDLPTDVTIVDPPPGDRISAPVFTMRWATGAQDGYEVRVLGETALGVPDEHKLLRAAVRVLNAATTREHTLTYPANGVVLHLQLRTVLAGLWSPWSTSRVVTGFTPPMRPQVLLDVDLPPSAITVVPTQPVSKYGSPEVTHVRIRRYVFADQAEPVLVADDWPPNEPFSDFTILSGVDYGYEVEAVSVTGSTARSAVRFYNPDPDDGFTPGTVAATVTATV